MRTKKAPKSTELNKQKNSNIYETKSKPMSKKVETDVLRSWKKSKKGKEQGKTEQENKKGRKREYLNRIIKQNLEREGVLWTMYTFWII
jgi:hypothetical protein